MVLPGIKSSTSPVGGPDIVPQFGVTKGMKVLVQLGSGSFGRVYKVQNEAEEVFALKKSKLNPKQIEREAEMTSLASRDAHPNVILLHAQFSVQEGNDKYQYLLIECMEMNLGQLMSRHSETMAEFGQDKAWGRAHVPLLHDVSNKLLHGILSGLTHIHSLYPAATCKAVRLHPDEHLSDV